MIQSAIACASLLIFLFFGDPARAAQAGATQGPQAAGTQQPGAQNAAPPDEPEHRGGFVPGQKRKTEDPALVARGKLLFGINCRGCHGADLRGGDLGGPNLLRSQVALSDLDGELIVPIIHGSRQKMGMPAIPINDADAHAVAAYVRTVIESIEGQGAPPSGGQEAPSILVGNANEGKDYFATKCGRCHSVTGDLRGLASRFKDPKKLQNAWLAGGSDEDDKPSRTVTATLTLPSGDVTGTLVRLDDFLVTLRFDDGSQKTFRRDGERPKIVLHDPLSIHKQMLSDYTDKDIHNLTAYLVTVK